jgi:hypothetical protein
MVKIDDERQSVLVKTLCSLSYPLAAYFPLQPMFPALELQSQYGP